MYLFSTPDSERFAFLVVGGQSGFAACPPLRKLLKPFGEQALRPDFISFLGVLNNYQKIFLTLPYKVFLLMLRIIQFFQPTSEFPYKRRLSGDKHMLRLDQAVKAIRCFLQIPVWYMYRL